MISSVSQVRDLYELSPMQQGMLFHSIYAPETGIYFEQRHCLLEGTLNVQAFKQAWQQVVDRYDVLRSEFHWEETDQPVQVVYQTAQLPWHEADWRPLSEQQQSQQLETFLVSERGQGFQLDRAPLMRCALFQLSDRTYCFVWSYHHLLMDGWCNGILIKEVLALYRSSCAGQPLALPPVGPYRNYIEWLQRQDKEQAEQYWTRALKGLSEPTSLGLEITERGLVESGDSSLQSEENQALSPSLSAALRDLSKQSRLTLNTLFQGAWSVLLSRYSGQADVLFGATVSGRPPELAGVESMVGLFINTVPVRSQLSPQATLHSWLENLQQSQRDREAYSYTSLTDIQSWSSLPSGSQLFESLLVFENYPLSIEAVTQDMGVGFTLKDAQGYEKTNYPLTLVIIPGETIQLSLRYDALRIRPAAIARMIGHLEAILESFTQGLEQKIEKISLLTQSEKQQLVTQGKGKSVDIPELCVHQQIEQQTQQRPDARAILFSAGNTSADDKRQTTTLTFQQLNHRANQIAHYLIEQGIQTGSRVGLFLPRSLDMVIALLAILKAGGTYVPLDPSHPAERTRHIVADAQLTAIISHRALVRTLSLPASVAALYLDEPDLQIQTQPTDNPVCAVSREDIAYILYTSGSTGKPKGVIIRHRSLNNFLAAMTEVTCINCKDTWLAVTTLGFDIAALEIFLPLLTGACLVITPTEVTIDGQQLIDQINAHQITLMQATPSTWRLLIDAGWRGKPALRAFCGGEALALSLAQQLLSQVNELWNLYGPTETTIWSGALQLTPAYLTHLNSRSGSAPIGGPIHNTQFYVLDTQKRQVPFGVAGELYISGEGVGVGYWQRPELSAKRFVRVPELTDERLYRTGDRVRYNEDGTLTYLGRLDYQIKLRGYRIELGEIEARLNQHPEVAQAIVTLTESNNPQLIAYLKLSSDYVKETDVDGIDSNKTARFKADIRQWLAQRLPAYMLPSGYAVLGAFPLTPNGKIDRRSLPAFTPEVAVDKPAEMPHQQLIAGIWAEVLGLDTVSLNDDFFALGGHSLLATRAVAQVRQVLGVDIPLRTLFEHSTLEDFCAQAQQQRQQPLPPIAPTNGLTLSSAQRRQWLMAQLAPESTAYSVPIAIQLTGKLSVVALKQSIAQVIARHETLRTVYPAVDGQPIPMPLTAGLDAEVLPVRDLADLDKKAQSAAVKQQIRQQARARFDLSQGPLWTALLLRLSDRKHILIFTFHHITIDGWSIGVLLKELTALYQAAQASQNLSQILPPLPVTYSDYVTWQQSLNLDSQRTYWQQQLSGLAPLLEIPTDYARSATATGKGSSYEFRLSRSEMAALQRFSQQNRVTLFMTLMAAFKALL
ncbi:MAG: amino acid adenylation domain-containing protein, partial [Cyanobacteria bacterium J06607_10]